MEKPISMNTNNENVVHKHLINTNNVNCLYFCPHFYKTFKNTCSIVNATVVEKFISKKVLAYCRDCQKAYIRYFTQLDELSNEYFFEENFLLNTTHPQQTIITMWYLIYETMTSKLFV